jgi:hypothetical protein
MSIGEGERRRTPGRRERVSFSERMMLSFGAIIDRAYAAAWYFPVLFVFRFSLVERKNEKQKKIKFRFE